MISLPAAIALNPLRSAAIIAAVALLALLGVQTWRLAAAKQGLAAAKQGLAEQRAEWQSKVAAAEAAARKKEGEMQQAVSTARKVLDETMAQIRTRDAQIVRLRVDRDQLHNDLINFAAGSPAADTIAACRDRADRLAKLLAAGAGLVTEGAELARTCAVAAEERGAKLNACLAAWPK